MAENEQQIHEQAALLAPGFFWSSERHAYLDSTGEIIPATQIRVWIDEALLNSRIWALDLTQQFIDGHISFEGWITQFRDEIKAMHTAMAQIAIGGTEQWGPVEAGRLGARLRQQYDYLGQLGLQIENGSQALDGTLLNRVRLFVESGRGTFEGMRRGMMEDGGMSEEMRVLGLAAHCIDCPPISGFWMPIGMLPNIGDSACMANCACSFDYR